MKIPRRTTLPAQTVAQNQAIGTLQRPPTQDRGTATLVGGTVTVACPIAQVTGTYTSGLGMTRPTGVFLVSYQSVSGTPGSLTAICTTAGQIVIRSMTSAGSLNTADTSTVAWLAI